MDKILLVLSPLNTLADNSSPPDFGYAHGIISFLSQQTNLTVFIPEYVDAEKYENYVQLNFGSRLKLVSLWDMDRVGIGLEQTRLLDYRTFINQSIQLQRYIRQSDYDCVIFDVFGAAGFIPIRAKRTGLDFGETLLVSWLRVCQKFQRLQALEPPKYPENFTCDLEMDFAERYCCQYCDLILSNTDTILKWVEEQDWKFDRAKVVRLSDLKIRQSLEPLREQYSEINSNRSSAQLHSQKSSPLVSVCIAHFNDGRNLRYLLKSIEKNDYRNFEVVVADDASTDPETLETFQSLSLEYNSESWRFLRKGENESLGPTRNFAARHARGEFIFFMDSDDLVSETLISDFVRGMPVSGADCLTCPLVYFEGDGEDLDETSIFKYWMPLGASVELGMYENPFGAANFCIRKSVFQALGGYRSPRGEVHEDWEFLARLVLAGYDMDVLPKPGYYYRVRPGSWLQKAGSKSSVQALRRRILANTGPQHAKYVQELFLLTMAENDRLRASAWNLDRKIVKIALRLADEVGEKYRVLIGNIGMTLLKSCGNAVLNVGRFVTTNVAHRFKKVKRETSQAFTQFQMDRSRYYVRSLSCEQMRQQTEELQLPLGRPIFALVGHMDQQGSIIGFLRLAYWMQMSRDDSFFVLVGNTMFESVTRSIAAKYNLKNFQWIPFLENTEDLYAVLSGCVTMSQSSNPSVEMSQALACGIPVFAAGGGPAKRLLEKYGSGVAVSHNPQHKDFADCFRFWKNNLEIYKTAAVETAGLERTNLERPQINS